MDQRHEGEDGDGDDIKGEDEDDSAWVECVFQLLPPMAD
jgi:hypothetical protein